MDFSRSRSSRNQLSRFFGGVSAIALAGATPAAFAQDTPEPEAQTAATPSQDDAPAYEGDDIIVRGIRASLQNAQEIKRNADTVVDAISAEDISALPDRSVNEALQRIPGVAITRFAAPDDSQHFSVEGSGVVIRGLGYVRGEFNGRDAFAASGGREIGFSDVPTELVGSIEVFKGLTSDLIEGGISGTVSINTRKPFDSTKDIYYLSTSVNYGDFVKKSAPGFAGLASKTFDLPGGGRIGVLASGSYNRQYNRSDRVFLSSFLPRFNAPNDGVDGYAVNGNYQGSQYDGQLCDGNNPNEGRILNQGTPYAVRACDAFNVPAGFDTVYTPLGGGFGSQEFDRLRTSFSGALQYENADRSLLITGQYLRALSKENWVERTTEPSVYYNDIGNTFPAGTLAPNQFSPNGMTTPGGFAYNPANQFTFDKNGIFTSGTLEETNTTQQHNVTTPCVIPNQGFPYTNTYCPYPQLVRTGTGVRFTNRYNATRSLAQDFSLNLKWTPTERLHLTFDGQYVKSEADQIDDIVDLQTYANPTIDLTGKVPQISFATPGFDTARYFSGVDSTIFYNDAYNNRNISDGDEWAFRVDADYDLSDDGFFRKIRVGGRYADRKQTVRTNDYNNWGSLSATWTDQGPRFVNEVTPNDVGLYSYGNFFRGGTTAPPASPFINESILRNHDALMDLLVNRAKDPSGQFSYTPIEDRGTDLIDGYFRPGEIYENSEKTYAGYARLDFATDFGGGRRLSGNIGARYVHTRDDSVGAITFPSRTQVISTFPDFASYCADQQSQANQPPPPGPVSNAPPQTQLPALCRPGVTDAQRNAVLAFADGSQLPQTARQEFDNFLPALNLRFDATNKLLFRFAASRAISRPNFGDLRNFLSIGFNGSTGAFEARSSNPFLRPITADQFDLTAEWYFAKVGSFTAAAFYKSLKNVILANSGFSRDVSNNGSTYTLQLSGPANAPGTTKIKGLEFGYQQTYDFLPGALAGLGVQATYTYIDAGKVQIAPPDYRASADPTPLEGDGYQPPLDVQGLYDNLELPGLSKHNFNASLFYDRNGLYLRAAYSWRSKYLLTNRDCCFPFLPVYAASYGQLDGSAFYAVNQSFKIGIEVQNLLDATTKTVFRLNGEGLESPRQYSKADRTYTISARMSF
ncbi:conserved exported hypothetical protein [Sphingomonas sp. EC-HK361]|uniref:TonB-dependent receptor n=1 Tax=Sphingomonas sp. EC-HK361 TaxID=2038397 RepID=UPI00125B972F|nr:TonB-dependent receptor [Sphingomonas sp. EC-HK361]VVT22009.1 conserved exported hypothetical protein [Sphingomonas sp. EC-HK361]